MVSLKLREDFVLESVQPANLKRPTLDSLKSYKIWSEVELIVTNLTQILKRTLIGNSKKASAKLNGLPDQKSLALLVSIVERLKRSYLYD